MSASGKPTVFVSYSHKDEPWKDKLLPQLRALEQAGRIVVWHDRKIDAGDKWYPEIKAAMEQAAVAVCLISADYLASDFCVKEEIPYLLERCQRDGMILIPVLLRPCPWKAFVWLKGTQMLPRDGKNVSIDFKDEEDSVFAELANNIFEIIDNPNYVPPKPPPPLWSPPEKIEISRLPRTGAELFGRQKELKMLDESWETGTTHVISLVAWGGVGKSTLVNKWLEQSETDNYRGARRVYAWSFYSQGTNERASSADLFINDALKFFGDPDPTAGSPWDKGERLAALVRHQRTLLVLDGLEPLQSPHAHERGEIKDPALSTLLTELARENPGLCLITTRERVTDLDEFSDTVLHTDLEQISDEAGRALLRVGGVRGTDAELEKATRDFGNHALAINLLAVYLHDIPGHHISHASTIPDLNIPVERGKHPRRLLAAFEQRFGPGPELELLRILGLFDRPADKLELRALRRAPVIPGLTDYIRKLTEAGWLRLIDKLRRTKLVAPQSLHRPDDIDAHPLVREHFGQQLKQAHLVAWRAGNNRLYEHLKRTAKVFPNTLEEMTPLYAAVAHGCEAGRHQEVFDQVYWRRLYRGEAFFSTRNLGAYGAGLAALASFFDLPWQQPIIGLPETLKAFLLNDVGVCLQSLGRTMESTQPMQASLEARIQQRRWKDAAVSAANLSGAFLTTGDLPQAINYAQQSIELADQTDDLFLRVISRARLGNAQHQAGCLLEAENIFRAAESMQNKQTPTYPILYSLQGVQYCDLMLDQGKYSEVLSRAEKFLEWRHPSDPPLTVALENLSLGRAYALQAQHEATRDFAKAASHITLAVDGLRASGSLPDLPLGLLARARLHLVSGEFDRAQVDLDRAMSIATRGSMGLHQADCHLEYARLYLARGEKERARGYLLSAKGMIARMGYHRRDGEAREIGELLDGGG